MVGNRGVWLRIGFSLLWAVLISIYADNVSANDEQAPDGTPHKSIALDFTEDAALASPAASNRSTELRISSLLPARSREWQFGAWLAIGLLLSTSIGALAYARSRVALLRIAEANSDELRREINEVSASAQRYRSLFDDSGVPNLLIDLEAACVVDANPPAAALCRRSVEQLRGQPLVALEPNWLGCALARCDRDQREPLRLQEVWTSQSGSEVLADIRITPLTVSGRRCWLATVYDSPAHRRSSNGARHTKDGLSVNDR